MNPATSFCPSRRSGGTRRCTTTSPATATSTGKKTVRMTYSAVAKADQPHSRYISVHYLGQRYILYNRGGNTSGAYSPNVLVGGFRELRLYGVLRRSSSIKSSTNFAFEVGIQCRRKLSIRNLCMLRRRIEVRSQ